MVRIQSLATIYEEHVILLFVEKTKTKEKRGDNDPFVISQYHDSRVVESL